MSGTVAMGREMRIFIGYDHRQPVSYTVLQHSIFSRASRPVAITPLVLRQLPIKRQGLTPFTYSRYLVPWLCDFQGVALFLDLDMLVLSDIAELFDLFDEKYAVMACTSLQRFEWASVMLYNCAHPDNRVLTPEHVDRGTDLGGIGWTDKIGSLPPEWNHLVLYQAPKPAKLIHYTAGIPLFPETRDLGFAEEWQREAKAATTSQPWKTLMGNSVHYKPVMERLGHEVPDAPTGDDPKAE